MSYQTAYPGYRFDFSFPLPNDGNGTLDYPQDVAIAANGDALAVNLIGKVWQFTNAGAQIGTPYATAPMIAVRRLNVSLSGNWFLANRDTHELTKFDWSWTQLAQWNIAAILGGPAGVALNNAETQIYVASHNLHRVTFFDNGNTNNSYSNVDTIGGPTPGAGNGQFNFPHDVAVIANGDLYVADTLNKRIQVFDNAGVYLRTVGGGGTLIDPHGVVLDSAQNLFVLDGGTVKMFNSAGTLLQTFGATNLSNPTGIAIDASRKIYVADIGNGLISVFSIPEPASSSLLVIAAAALLMRRCIARAQSKKGLRSYQPLDSSLYFSHFPSAATEVEGNADE
jgi:hypothetical protein